MKVAVVHDILVTYAGSERVLEQILRLYPDADLFSVADFIPADQRGFILNKTVRTSFVQHLPFARTRYRSYLALMPIAVEQFDLSGYDLVISSSYAVAKGVLTGPDQLHISYIHTPIRYAWDQQHHYLTDSYLGTSLKGLLARLILHYIRIWDYRTANGVDVFLANSRSIARRVQKTYRREATVIYPPVDTSFFTMGEARETFYLTGSRLVYHKKIDLVVDAFTGMPDKQLIVIGDGPDYNKIKAKASPNIQLIGSPSMEIIRRYMQRARAFVFAAEEDFGIMPLEAQACGTPVIAYGKGGLSETIRGQSDARPTGVFFDLQSVESIIAAVGIFEDRESSFDPEECRRNALHFSTERFSAEFDAQVRAAWDRFVAERGTI